MSNGPSRRAYTPIAFLLLACALVALRIGYATVLKFDSDEPQHLHVVWAWATGQLPYHDVFDNHAPLFQFLCAPLFRLIPERADIVIPMRWAMLPLYGLALYGVYRMAAAFYSRNLAFLIAVSGSLCPAYFLKSAEFRPDDMWAAVWFLALAALLGGPMTIRRFFLFGLLLGVSFAVSMKTTLFVLALGVALLIVLGLKIVARGDKTDRLLLAKGVGVALLGTLIVPAVVIGFFWLKGIQRELWYGVIEHNIVPHLKRWQKPGYLQAWFPLTLVGLIVGAALVYFRTENRELRERATLTFLIPGCYILVLYGFWPDIPREDDLPLYPLIPLSIWLLAEALLPKATREKLPRWATGLAWFVVVAQIGWLFNVHKPWDRENRSQIAMIARVLEITHPGEYVMDAKSGAIYRPRPYFYALETITIDRIRKGLIVDDIPKRLIDTGTKVAMMAGLMNEDKSRPFIKANYLPIKERDNVYVVGKLIGKGDAAAEGAIHFDVIVPADYSVIDRQGPVSGVLDGKTIDGPVDLAKGPHEFRPARAVSDVAIFWNRPLEKGFHLEFPKVEPERKDRPAS